MKTTISYTIQSTLPPSINSQGGYALDISVAATNQIDSSIFIYQRSPVSDGSETYEDFFYSVASVADIYSIPVNGPGQVDGFYRTDSISLVFSSMEDLNSSLSSIREAISDLCRANDSFMNLSSVKLAAFPPSASNIYIGTVGTNNHQPSDSEIKSMLAVQEPSLPLSKTIQAVAQGEYVCVAFPTVFGLASISINGSEIESTTTVRDLEGPTGLVQAYTILVAQESVSGTIDLVLHN